MCVGKSLPTKNPSAVVSRFNDAAAIEPYCVEAIYNLGLASVRLRELPYAIVAFKKLHAMLPESVEVVYQIANCYDIAEEYKAAVQWFEMLHTMVPNDPGVLARLGALHSRLDRGEGTGGIVLGGRRQRSCMAMRLAGFGLMGCLMAGLMS